MTPRSSEQARQYAWQIEAENEGARIDHFLALQIDDLSRSQAQRLIKDGHVTCDGETVTRSSCKLVSGQQINLMRPIHEVISIEAQPLQLNILYEDDDIIVINKEQGLLVHPGAGSNETTLVHAVAAIEPNFLTAFDSSAARPGVVHRLDRDTSGAVVIAKHEQARQHLAEQFASRQVTKRYIAIVAGHPPDEKTFSAPIGRRQQDRKKYTSKRPVRSRPAVTHLRTLARDDDSAVVQVEIETGRTHQIRVHLTDNGYPILGDPWYGRQAKMAPRLMLHAWQLGFTHPKSGTEVSVTAPPPSVMQEMIRKRYGDTILDSFNT